MPDPDRAAVMTVTFSALGPVRAWRDGFELPLGTSQQRTTLALLLEREGRVVTTGELVDALWPPSAPTSAVATIRTYAYRLRRLLAGDPVRLDTWRERLEELGRIAVHARLATLVELGEYDDAIAGLREQVAERPLPEPGHELLITALLGAGRRADALTHFRRVRYRFHRFTGDLPAAIAAFGKATDLYGDMADLRIEPFAGLYACHRDTGDHAAAAQARREALRLLETARHPDLPRLAGLLGVPLTEVTALSGRALAGRGREPG